jgi:hypothetical protein
MSNVRHTIDRYEKLGRNDGLGLFAFNANYNNGGVILFEGLSEPLKVRELPAVASARTLPYCRR